MIRQLNPRKGNLRKRRPSAIFTVAIVPVKNSLSEMIADFRNMGISVYDSEAERVPVIVRVFNFRKKNKGYVCAWD